MEWSQWKILRKPSSNIPCGMNMVRPWSTIAEPWLDHGQWPWLTMVWQCFDHVWTMVDHGHVKWPPLLTMADHGQATMVWPWSTMVSSTFKNQMTWSESWSNTWCADIQISTPLGDEHGRTMVDHGWPWSGNVLTMIEPWLTMVRLYQATMVSSTFKNQMTMVNHGQIPDVLTFKSTHL